MIVDCLENLPGYPGLLSEVRVADAYKLRSLDFTPDLILDLGANVGVFARYAKCLFPHAVVVCIEPDLDNYRNLHKFTPNVVHWNAAIGKERVWKTLNAIDGTHGCYLSAGDGYPEQELVAEEGKTLEPSDLPVMTVADLVKIYRSDNYQYPGHNPPLTLLKMDIEGNEHTVFDHEPSLEAMRQLDYIAIEVHKYALHGGLEAIVAEKADAALKSFEATHDISWDHVNFFARKKHG